MKTFRNDPIGFVDHYFDMRLTDGQEQTLSLIEDIYRDDPEYVKHTVHSPMARREGSSALAALVALWWIHERDGIGVIIGHAESVIGEVHELAEKTILQDIRATMNKIRMGDKWQFVGCEPMSAHPERFAGMNYDDILIFIDGAYYNELPETTRHVFSGTMTGPRSLIVETGSYR